jgi:hypothetical protein
MTEKLKPTVYIASPYTKGDVAINTYFQCKVFDELLTDGRVLPVAPLWSHFQHTVFPRPYQDWIQYDQEMLRLYDCCLRLDATLDRLNYVQHESSGADAEVKTFKAMGKPVFFSIEELYTWVDGRMNG